MPHNTTNTTNNHGRRSRLENQKVFGAQNSSVSPHGPVQPQVLKRIFSMLCFFCCSPYLTQHMDTELTLILQLDHFPLMSSWSYPFLLHLSEAHPPPHSSRLSTNVPSSMKASPALPDRINSSLPYLPKGFCWHPAPPPPLSHLMYSPDSHLLCSLQIGWSHTFIPSSPLEFPPPPGFLIPYHSPSSFFLPRDYHSIFHIGQSQYSAYSIKLH